MSSSSTAVGKSKEIDFAHASADGDVGDPRKVWVMERCGISAGVADPLRPETGRGPAQ